MSEKISGVRKRDNNGAALGTDIHASQKLNLKLNPILGGVIADVARRIEIDSRYDISSKVPDSHNATGLPPSLASRKERRAHAAHLRSLGVPKQEARTMSYMNPSVDSRLKKSKPDQSLSEKAGQTKAQIVKAVVPSIPVVLRLLDTQFPFVYKGQLVIPPGSSEINKVTNTAVDVSQPVASDAETQEIKPENTKGLEMLKLYPALRGVIYNDDGSKVRPKNIDKGTKSTTSRGLPMHPKKTLALGGLAAVALAITGCAPDMGGNQPITNEQLNATATTVVATQEAIVQGAQTSIATVEAPPTQSPPELTPTYDELMGEYRLNLPPRARNIIATKGVYQTIDNLAKGDIELAINLTNDTVNLTTAMFGFEADGNPIDPNLPVTETGEGYTVALHRAQYETYEVPEGEESVFGRSQMIVSVTPDENDPGSLSGGAYVLWSNGDEIADPADPNTKNNLLYLTGGVGGYRVSFQEYNGMNTAVRTDNEGNIVEFVNNSLQWEPLDGSPAEPVPTGTPEPTPAPTETPTPESVIVSVPSDLVSSFPSWSGLGEPIAEEDKYIVKDANGKKVLEYVNGEWKDTRGLFYECGPGPKPLLEGGVPTGAPYDYATFETEQGTIEFYDLTACLIDVRMAQENDPLDVGVYVKLGLYQPGDPTQKIDYEVHYGDYSPEENDYITAIIRGDKGELMNPQELYDYLNSILTDPSRSKLMQTLIISYYPPLSSNRADNVSRSSDFSRKLYQVLTDSTNPNLIVPDELLFGSMFYR